MVINQMVKSALRAVWKFYPTDTWVKCNKRIQILVVVKRWRMSFTHLALRYFEKDALPGSIVHNHPVFARACDGIMMLEET